MTIGQMQIFGLSYDEMSQRAANFAIDQICCKPTSSFGFPWGNSPKGMYTLLSSSFPDFFGEAKAFALDDVIGSRQIGQELLHEQLFKNINLKRENRFSPTAVTPAQYEEQITAARGLDVLYLGLGLEGHLGFNEPGTSFDTRTHKVQLHESTIQDCKAKYGIDVKEGITMGLATMMEAMHVVLLVSGENKREIARKALFEPVTPEVPASILQLHPRVLVLADFKL
jgi:glucosamine-6-phosphate deaminase